jgi:ring-1,2-phenylacetyl-CoA epoxidase subunit PaaD
MASTSTTLEDEIWKHLDEVKDPEIPVLTVNDLGIIRKVEQIGPNGVRVTITPTYSGCPAMNMIEIQIKAALEDEGYDPVEVITQLDPPWTTDWMTEAGKKKLKNYGIAPPKSSSREAALLGESEIECPHCGSTDTKVVSQFGSTPCKALYQCKDCQEPFDYFKCH